jgi:hypothetical protein
MIDWKLSFNGVTDDNRDANPSRRARRRVC